MPAPVAHFVVEQSKPATEAPVLGLSHSSARRRVPQEPEGRRGHRAMVGWAWELQSMAFPPLPLAVSLSEP